jgi:hypothetical protein
LGKKYKISAEKVKEKSGKCARYREKIRGRVVKKSGEECKKAA